MSSYVIAIDVGVKNLGICVWDFDTTKIELLSTVSLVPQGRYIPGENVAYVRNFLARFKPYFADAKVVLIERQMRVNMRIIQSVIQALYFEKCIVVSPRLVKMHYDLSTKSYKGNKAKSVEWATEFALSNPGTFATGVTNEFSLSKKKDDMADALIMVLYYLDTYSNQLTVDK
jgi:hypothetical protein